MRKPILSILLLMSSWAGAATVSCGPVIGELELYSRLAKDPHFMYGIPPPGKVMRVEKDVCGYRLYVGITSPDSFGNEIFIIDGQGKILDIISGY